MEYNDIKWKDKVLINTVDYRFLDIDYNIINEKYPNSIFISFDWKQYEYFINKSKLEEIKFYKVQNFNEMCLIINSCQLFIGSASGFLAVAEAFDKKRIIDQTCIFHQGLVNKNIINYN